MSPRFVLVRENVPSVAEVVNRSLKADSTDFKPGFHLQQTPRPRHKKQSGYVVEQSSFPLLALFWLKIGRCRGRNWLNGNQALHSV